MHYKGDPNLIHVELIRTMVNNLELYAFKTWFTIIVYVLVDIVFYEGSLHHTHIELNFFEPVISFLDQL
jgi:hypothetical protein